MSNSINMAALPIVTVSQGEEEKIVALFFWFVLESRIIEEK